MQTKPPLNQRSTVSKTHFWLAGVIALALSLINPVANAAVLTWSGGGGVNANWSIIANWGSVGAPNNGDTLIFPAGAPDLINTNNITGLTLNQIVFKGAGGGYGLNGMAFTLTNGIIATNTAGVNNISNSISLTTITAATNILVVVSNGVTLTLDGILSGSMGVTKTGVGTLIYQGPGSNPYTGATMVSGGTLELNVGGATAFGGPLVIGDGMVEDLQTEEMANIGPITINPDGTLNLNNCNEPIDFPTSISINEFGDIETGSGTLTLSPNTTITVLSPINESHIDGNLNTGGSGTLTITGTSSMLDVTANVSGLANINQTGSVTIDWEGNNTYTGNYTANGACQVWLGEPASLGNTNNTFTLNDASLVYLLRSFNLTNQSVVFNSSNSYNVVQMFPNATNTWQSSFVLSNTCTVGLALGQLTWNGPVSGPAGLDVLYSGVMVLGGSTANSYSGATMVGRDLGGLGPPPAVLLLDKPYATPAIPGPLVIVTNAIVKLENGFQIHNPAIPVAIYDGCLLDLNGNGEWVGQVTMQGAQITAETGTFYFSGDIIVNASSVAQSVISGNADIWAGTYSITNTGHNFSPDLVISANVFSGGGGTPGLIKDGGGEVSLAGLNGFTGPVTVNNGNLWARTSSALGNTNMPVTVNNGGSLFLDGSGLDFGLKPLVLNGPGSAFGALFCSGSSSWEGTVTLASDSQIYLFSGSTLFVNGQITGAGGYTEAGAGTLAVGGTVANNYGGNTTVDGGLLLLSNGGFNAAIPGNLDIYGTVRLAIPYQLPTTANVTVETTGLFDLFFNYDFINNLQGAGTVNFGSGGWLSVGNNNGTSEFDGSFTGIGYNPGYTVGKSGSGTFTIGGNSSYTAGITHVLGGKLIVNGSQPLISMLIDNGATLAGSGIVGAMTNNGTIYPGNTLGILNSGSVLFSSTSDFTVQLSGPTPGAGGYDQLNVTGTVNLANTTLTVIPNFTTPPAIGQQYIILQNDGFESITGTFNGLPDGAIFTTNGYTFRINYSLNGNNDVVLTLVGEPGNTLTINAEASGWYDSTGAHEAGNLNYYAGEAPGGSMTNFYRNWFVFTAPVFTGPVIHAELVVNCYTNQNPTANDYILRRVTTAPSVLEADATGATNIYNNLGTDVVYAVRNISTLETGQKAIIPLDVQFFNDVKAAGGNEIALGGTVFVRGAPTGNVPGLFGYSQGSPGDVQLRLTLGAVEVITAVNRGWYSSAGGYTVGNNNYAIGSDGTFLYNNFFLWSLPGASGQLVDAELLLYAGSITSSSGVENYQLFDVTNPITALTNSQTSARNIYADLGSGISYGGRKIYASEAGLTMDIPLGNGFLGAARTHGNSALAIGGTINSSADVYFGNTSGAATDVQLWLGYTSSPFTAPTMMVTNRPAYAGSGVYQFVVSGTAATTNEIQASFDYVNWDYIGDLPMTGATTGFNYTNNAVVPYRYFRAEQLQ